MDVSTFDILSIVAIAFLALMLFLALFEPGLRYRISVAPQVPLDSEDFQRLLGALVNAPVHRHNRIAVLTNGNVFYEAELEAISAAHHSINIEAYIFQKGDIARRFIAALTERAQAGVLPLLHLDHVYYEDSLDLESMRPHRSRTALVASDHLPLVADFRLRLE